MIELLGQALEILFGFFLIFLAGVMAAQVLKLIPLWLALAGSLSFAPGFPHKAYNNAKIELKMFPLRFLLLPLDYFEMQISEGDIIGFIGAVIAFPAIYLTLFWGIWVGFWRVSVIRGFLRVFRINYNLN